MEYREKIVKFYPQPQRGDFTIFYLTVTNEIHIRQSTHLHICTSKNQQINKSKNQTLPILPRRRFLPFHFPHFFLNFSFFLIHYL